MVGMMGTAVLTKKRMGYTNTKLHGIMATMGLVLTAVGFYVIYENKNQMGKTHFTTWHSWGECSCILGIGILCLLY
jgi:hypothetical protein